MCYISICTLKNGGKVILRFGKVHSVSTWLTIREGFLLQVCRGAFANKICHKNAIFKGWLPADIPSMYEKLSKHIVKKEGK